MVNSLSIERWQYEAINHLLLTGDTRLVLIIKGSNDSLVSKIQRIWDAGFSRIMFAVYRDFLCRPKSLKRERFDSGDTPILECKIFRKGKYSEYFSEDDIKRIQDHNLDFVLRFGFSYEDNEEAAELISNILVDLDLFNKTSRRAVERAKLFSSQAFRDNFSELMEA